jgi:hypothetical protein
MLHKVEEAEVKEEALTGPSPLSAHPLLPHAVLLYPNGCCCRANAIPTRNTQQRTNFSIPLSLLLSLLETKCQQLSVK